MYQSIAVHFSSHPRFKEKGPETMLIHVHYHGTEAHKSGLILGAGAVK